MTRRRLLFVHNTPSSWVVQDLADLREAFDVREIYFRNRLQDAWAILMGTLWADGVFGWFASVHSFLGVLAAKLLGRPSWVVIGGYDTAILPEIAYGNLRSGPRRWITLLALRGATCLLPVSRYAADEARRNAKVSPEAMRLLYHGYPPPPDGVPPKQAMVLTVGIVNESNLQRKGLLAFVEVARHVPEATFVLMGSADPAVRDALERIAPDNLVFTGFVSDSERDQTYARAAVYLQLSAHEAFGSSVAEAMRYGCVPVVSDRGALPEVVGEAGLVVPLGDPAAAAEAVRVALGRIDLRERARERIAKEFPRQARREGLVQAVSTRLEEAG